MEDDLPLREALAANRHAVGSPDYMKKVEGMLQGLRTGGPADRDLAIPRPLVDLEAIDLAVAESFGLSPEDLRCHGRRAGGAKALAIELACRLTDLNQRQIGVHYGGITSMAVCMARRRFRPEAAGAHVAIQRRLGEIEEGLTGVKLSI